MEYDFEKESLYRPSVSTISSSSIDREITDIDPEIEDIMADYIDECEQEASKTIVGSANGYFDRYEVLPNLMCQAIYTRAISEGYEVDFSFCNEARHYLGRSYGNSTFNYSDVFEAFPFDNEVYIIEITADEIRNEVLNWNRICKDPDKTIYIDDSKTYRVACVDYLAFHTSQERICDYFPSQESVDYKDLPKLRGNYRDIICGYLSNGGYGAGGKTLYASDYSSSLPQFSKSGFVERY